jgi:hypothetical protein
MNPGAVGSDPAADTIDPARWPGVVSTIMIVLGRIDERVNSPSVTIQYIGTIRTILFLMMEMSRRALTFQIFVPATRPPVS